MRTYLKPGDIFNRWTLDRKDATSKREKWFCTCSCGIQKRVFKQNLINQTSKSCGCYSLEVTKKGFGEIPGVYWSRLKGDCKRRHRKNKLKFDISIEYAWGLFITQNKICALSGMPIQFAQNTKDYWTNQTTASLDRIDSSIGYVFGNVQWVHKDINKMKSDLDFDEFVVIMKQILKTLEER